MTSPDRPLLTRRDFLRLSGAGAVATALKFVLRGRGPIFAQRVDPRKEDFQIIPPIDTKASRLVRSERIETPLERIYSLTKDSLGNLWIAGEGKETSLAMLNKAGEWMTFNETGSYSRLVAAGTEGQVVAAGERLVVNDGRGRWEELPPIDGITSLTFSLDERYLFAGVANNLETIPSSGESKGKVAGVVQFNLQTKQARIIQGIEENIYALVGRGDGILWAGGEHGGYRLNEDQSWLHFPVEDGIAQLTVDRYGSVVGVSGSGYPLIFSEDEQEWHRLSSRPAIPQKGGRVEAFITDPQRGMWFGGGINGGWLTFFSGSHTKIITKNLPPVSSLLVEAGDGENSRIIHLGTEGGLYRTETNL